MARTSGIASKPGMKRGWKWVRTIRLNIFTMRESLWVRNYFSSCCFVVVLLDCALALYESVLANSDRSLGSESEIGLGFL